VFMVEFPLIWASAIAEYRTKIFNSKSLGKFILN